MTQKSIAQQPAATTSLTKCMLIGTGIALLAILYFVIGEPHPQPDWGKFWRVRPLIITPLSGACGGAFYYLMGGLRRQGGWKQIAANALSIIVYIVGVWLGIVLGLAGTMWH